MNTPNDSVTPWFNSLVLFLVGIGFIIYSFFNSSVYFLLFGVLVIVCCILMLRQTNKVDCYKCKESVSSSALICKHCNENFSKSYRDSYVSIWEHINFSIKGYLQRCFWGVVAVTLFLLVGRFTHLLGPVVSKIPAGEFREDLIGFPIFVCAVFVPLSYIWKFFKLRYNTWGDTYWYFKSRVDSEPQVTHEPVMTVIDGPSVQSKAQPKSKAVAREKPKKIAPKSKPAASEGKGAKGTKTPKANL